MKASIPLTRNYGKFRQKTNRHTWRNVYGGASAFRY